MNYPPPQPQPPLQPVKKGMSGCMIALIVVGGILLLGGLTVGLVVYKVMSSPEGQKAMAIAGDGIKLAADSTTAPGTAELRALGCTQAAVIDAEKFEALAKEIDADAGAQMEKETKGKTGLKAIITCTVPSASSGPTCEDVAKTYVRTIKPAGNLLVTVSTQGNGTAKCSGEYSSSGVKMETKGGK